MGVMSFSGLPYRVLTVLVTALLLLGVGSVSAAKADDPGSVFELQNFVARALDADGNDYTVAGGHPYDAVTSFSFPTRNTPGGVVPVEPPKSTFTELPPGFLANLAGAPRCPLSLLAANPSFALCPAATRIGTMRLDTLGDQSIRKGCTTWSRSGDIRLSWGSRS